jgi:hypothetical protein
MPCIGVECDIRKENVSFFECSVCDKCNKFPDLLKRKFLFPSIRSGTPRISVTMLTSCPKQSYLKMKKDYYMGRTGIIAMNIGSALHEYLEGVSDISEKFIRWTTPEGHECVGYLDALSVTKRILYELKTTPHGWPIRDYGAKDQHILQIQLYATILKKMHGVDLHGLKLIYVGLGDKDCMEIDVPFEDKSDFLNQKTNMLQKHRDENTVPKGEPMWPEWECVYCPFSEDCAEKIIPEKKSSQQQGKSAQQSEPIQQPKPVQPAQENKPEAQESESAPVSTQIQESTPPSLQELKIEEIRSKVKEVDVEKPELKEENKPEPKKENKGLNNFITS